MKYVFILIFLIAPYNDLNKIKKINDYKRQAKEAYLENDFETAASAYKYLIDSLDVDEPEVQLNYANSLFYLNDTLQARSNYAQVASNGDKNYKSIAHQQLGLMDYYSTHYEESLKHFKESLKADPTNQDARYNYELLKKVLQEQEQDPQQQQQNEDSNEDDQSEENQENQDQQQDQQEQQQDQDQEQQQQEQEESEQQENQEQQQQDQEGEKSEEQQQEEQEQQQQQEQQEGENEENQEDQLDPSISEKLEEMNISEEKARMILEALKNNEIQYLQQNKRKAKKRPEKGKPDW